MVEMKVDVEQIASLLSMEKIKEEDAKSNLMKFSKEELVDYIIKEENTSTESNSDEPDEYNLD